MLRPILERILLDYPGATTTSFAQNPLVAFIRSEAPKALTAQLPPTLASMQCVGSGGAGNFATVPWLAVFDPLITANATRGYYVVYLFNKEENSVYLSLNQGATATRAEFGSRAPQILRERAAFMRERVRDYALHFESTPIQLSSSLNLPKDYEAGHAFGRQYVLHTLPSEAELQADFRRIVQSYDALTHRGGLTTDIKAEEPSTAGPATITETRQYTYHKRIERNAAGARLAKKLHGTTCQACGFNFTHQYGPLGQDFIEAHHLKPLGELAEGVAVAYDLATDFAVLCANCHRMIHRTDDASDLAGFKMLIQKTF